MDHRVELKEETSENPDRLWVAVHEPVKSLTPPPLVPNDTDLFNQTMMPKTLHWSIPWADLMMTMFILFAVLFVYQASNRDTKYTESPTAESDLVVAAETFFSIPEPPKDVSEEISEPDPPKDGPKEISDLYEMSQQTIKADGLKDIASVELVEDKAVRIILTGDVFFDTGKADLKPGAIESLHKVTGMLKETPHVVNVVGHTDDVPIHTDRFASNWELSTARACMTARFLIKELGISPNQIYVSGHGEYQPVQPNDTPAGRLANRRVEIIITKEKPLGIAEASVDVLNAGASR